MTGDVMTFDQACQLARALRLSIEEELIRSTQEELQDESEGSADEQR